MHYIYMFYPHTVCRRDSRRSNSDGGNETLPEDKSGDRPYHLSTTEYRGVLLVNRNYVPLHILHA